MSEKMNTVDLIIEIKRLENVAKEKIEDAQRLKNEADGIMFCVDSLKNEFEMNIRHYNISKENQE